MKEFNDTGLCIPQRHYMVDTTPKVEQVINLVERGKYFTINRPRQFGKTTTMFLLDRYLNQQEHYIALKISFEGLDSQTHQQLDSFIAQLLILLERRLAWLKLADLSQWVKEQRPAVTNLPSLSHFISDLVQTQPNHAWVLMIDEVDKSSNQQLFLDFLGILRNKYLSRDDGEPTFQAVILAGVHDIKTIKAKFRPDEATSLNSPWNIAVDFTVDLSFSPTDIETMLHDYAHEQGIAPDIPVIAQTLYDYTSGYPYLVSKLCKFIDEQIVPQRSDPNWTVADVEAAFAMIVDDAYTTTLFDSLTKNLESYPELYDLVFQIAINGQRLNFAIADPIINLGHMVGILNRSAQKYCQIHNRIFEQRIYAYMLSKAMRTRYTHVNQFGGPEYVTEKGLDVWLILQRFQAFMKEHYASRDAMFLEREGRLLFLAFLRPILNGRGFEFKEPNVADERRMDIVITYQSQRYVIELKRWYGERYHQQGLQQLSDYLDRYGLPSGYLLIYDFRQSKQYKEETINFGDKTIFAVWV